MDESRLVEATTRIQEVANVYGIEIDDDKINTAIITLIIKEAIKNSKVDVEQIRNITNGKPNNRLSRLALGFFFASISIVAMLFYQYAIKNLTWEIASIVLFPTIELLLFSLYVWHVTVVE